MSRRRKGHPRDSFDKSEIDDAIRDFEDGSQDGSDDGLEDSEAPPGLDSVSSKESNELAEAGLFVSGDDDTQLIYESDIGQWEDTQDLFAEMDQVIGSDMNDPTEVVAAEFVIDTANAVVMNEPVDDLSDSSEVDSEVEAGVEARVEAEGSDGIQSDSPEATFEVDADAVQSESFEVDSEVTQDNKSPVDKLDSKSQISAFNRVQDELTKYLGLIRCRVIDSEYYAKIKSGFKSVLRDLNWTIEHNGVSAFIGVIVGVCASLTLYGLMYGVMERTSNDYSLKMNSMINRLTIGESNLNSLTIGSSGDQESEVNDKEFYDLDQYLLLNEISSVVTTGLPNEVSYLEKVIWNGFDVYIPEDMKDFEAEVTPLKFNIRGSDLMLNMSLLRFNGTVSDFVKSKLVEFQNGQGISSSVIESSKEEEHRAFLQLTYKKITSDGNLESRTRYIAMVQLTQGIGLLCEYDSGPQAPVNSQSLLFDSLIANVTDRFI